MSSLNTAAVLGNLTRDPEMRTTPQGSSVTTFGIATNRKWKDKSTNQLKEEVEFHSIVAWGRLAEICHQYLKKGSQVYIGGRLKTQSWEKDGHKNYRTEIIAENMVMVGGKGNQQASAPASAPAQNEAPPAEIKIPAEEVKIDDLPF